ncbi:MAG: M18 family aminopeptidase, partial [Lentisphaeria bacterium]|nr:M18 family aminopeptidase [Lentisphaeria bacterium]
AHTDSPALKIKMEGASAAAGCVRVSTEVYGGAIVATWLDRPLSLAGRVMIRDGEAWTSRIVDLQRPIAVVPNLAVHLNRDINKGVEYNRQTQLQAILCTAIGEEKHSNVLCAALAEACGTEPDAIGEADLFLYDPTPAVLVGTAGDFLNAPRIDNLAGCHAIAEAMVRLEPTSATCVAVLSDNEEVGSRTPQGADSSFPRDILQRVVVGTGGAGEDFFRAMAHSFMLSVDAAHAIHPSYADKHDGAYAPVLNGGPVIKSAAACRYATTAETAARFHTICTQAGIPFQRVINRSDIPSGTTIGPITSAALGVPTLDIGHPLWAMHSIRETAGARDHGLMITALEAFLGQG